MKSKEAPEKLYVNFHFIETHPGNHQPLVTKQGINKYDIEYIRTDAFIEKACAWFRKVKEQECSFDGIDSFIIHFKEAMKL